MKKYLMLVILTLASLLSMSRCGGGGLCSDGCDKISNHAQEGSFQHMVFVTSARVSGNLGGLEGADKICAQLAREGDRTKSLTGNWKAVLSDGTTSSKDRLTLLENAPIENTNGEIIARGKDLWSGSLSAPIVYDQNGNPQSEKLQVWSGTLSSGDRLDEPALVTNCTNWNDNSTVTNAGVIGMAGATDKTWIEAEDFVGCAKTDEKARLYCINSYGG